MVKLNEVLLVYSSSLATKESMLVWTVRSVEGGFIGPLFFKCNTRDQGSYIVDLVLSKLISILSNIAEEHFLPSRLMMIGHFAQRQLKMINVY